MKKYSSYKDSEVEYLGSIPLDWHIKRIKDFCVVKGRIGFKGYTKNDFVDKGEGALVIGATEMNAYGFLDIKSPQYISWFKYYESPEIMLKTNQLLIVQRGSTVGKVAIVDDSIDIATINPSLAVIKNIKGNERFLLYYLNSSSIQGFVKAQTSLTAIPMISQEQIGKYEICFPSIAEQTAIAEYLDTKTQAIDKKVSLLEKKIGYYQELRKSLINEIVTKGLDKSVKLKDSGIDWIGQIPEHWEVRRLKDLGNIETSSVNKKIEEDEKLVRLVNYVDVFNNPSKEIWNSEDFMTVSANELQVRSKRLKKGDALFTPSSETIEDIGVSSIVMENLENSLYSYHLIRLRFTTDFNIDFKKYILNNNKVQYYFSHSATGTTRKILGLNTFYNLPIVFPPPKKEQEQIGQFLKKKTSIIDQIITNIQTQITTLKELRKTLINDVVTGKIRVSHE